VSLKNSINQQLLMRMMGLQPFCTLYKPHLMEQECSDFME